MKKISTLGITLLLFGIIGWIGMFINGDAQRYFSGEVEIGELVGALAMPMIGIILIVRSLRKNR